MIDSVNNAHGWVNLGWCLSIQSESLKFRTFLVAMLLKISLHHGYAFLLKVLKMIFYMVALTPCSRSLFHSWRRYHSKCFIIRIDLFPNRYINDYYNACKSTALERSITVCLFVLVLIHQHYCSL